MKALPKSMHSYCNLFVVYPLLKRKISSCDVSENRRTKGRTATTITGRYIFIVESTACGGLFTRHQQAQAIYIVVHLLSYTLIYYTSTGKDWLLVSRTAVGWLQAQVSTGQAISLWHFLQNSFIAFLFLQ